MATATRVTRAILASAFLVLTGILVYRVTQVWPASMGIQERKAIRAFKALMETPANTGILGLRVAKEIPASTVIREQTVIREPTEIKVILGQKAPKGTQALATPESVVLKVTLALGTPGYKALKETPESAVAVLVRTSTT